MLEKLFPGLSHLQNLHPLLVHFPIAFLLGAALLYFVATFSRNPDIAWAAFWMLLFAAVGGLASVASGLYASEGLMIATTVREALLEYHKRLMIAATAFTVFLAAWAFVARPIPRHGRWIFLIALVAICLLMSEGADFGGRMVYDYNAGGNACSQPIDFSK